MKKALIWLLDIAAWLLKLITPPLKFIIRRVLPAPETLQPGEAPEREIKSARPTPAGLAFRTDTQPAIEEQPTPIKPAAKVKPGWFSLPLENLPHPTYWPVVLALGLIFLVFGVVTSFVFSIVGAIMFILGITGWIGDMWNEQPE